MPSKVMQTHDQKRKVVVDNLLFMGKDNLLFMGKAFFLTTKASWCSLIGRARLLSSWVCYFRLGLQVQGGLCCRTRAVQFAAVRSGAPELIRPLSRSICEGLCFGVTNCGAAVQELFTQASERVGGRHTLPICQEWWFDHPRE